LAEQHANNGAWSLLIVQIELLLRSRPPRACRTVILPDPIRWSTLSEQKIRRPCREGFLECEGVNAEEAHGIWWIERGSFLLHVRRLCSEIVMRITEEISTERIFRHEPPPARPSSAKSSFTRTMAELRCLERAAAYRP